jgi:hypothetical protein
VADNIKFYEGGFKAGFNHLEIKLTEVQPLSGDMALSTGESRITGKTEKGDPLDATVIWTALDVRENGQWKIRMLTSVPKPPPQPQQAASSRRLMLGDESGGANQHRRFCNQLFRRPIIPVRPPENELTR